MGIVGGGGVMSCSGLKMLRSAQMLQHFLLVGHSRESKFLELHLPSRLHLQEEGKQLDSNTISIDNFFCFFIINLKF